MRNNLKSSVALTNLCLVLFLLIALACKCGSDNNETTTVILVRHAEKSAEPKEDPDLTQAGFERADLLERMLKGKNIKTIYTSKYQRTRNTAKPLADELGIIPIEINEAEQIAQSVLNNNQGQTVLIVGHTNTIPKIIKNLGGEEIEGISEADFDNMFTLTLTPNKPVKVVNTKY